MSLSCGCEDYDIQIVRERDVKARKEHVCGECDKAIKPGEVLRLYDLFNYEEQQPVRPFKQCETCTDLHDNLSALGYCIGLGKLMEAYDQYLELQRESGKIMKPRKAA